MATEKEAAFPIEDFDGLNRQSEREDMLPTQLYDAQNLWEKTLGTLETRGHSVTLTGTLPSGIADLGKIHKSYKAWGSRRFCAIKCTSAVEVLGALPAGVAISFVDDTTAYWNVDFAIGGTTFATNPNNIIVRFVGYGWDKYYKVAKSAITGYNVANKQKLRLAVTAAQDTNITGIEILAGVMAGVTDVPATVTGTSNYNEKTLWVGFQELVSASTVTVDFKYCPYTYDGSMVTPLTLGAVEREFTATAYNNADAGATAGTLEAGRTYHVAILPQYTVFSANPDSRCAYRQVDTNMFQGDIKPVTIPGDAGTFGGISIGSVSPTTGCYLIVVGDTDRTLQPYAIINDSPVVTTAKILSSPRYNPGVVRVSWTAATIATLSFCFSDFSRKDMFLGINNNGSIYPIFAADVGPFGSNATSYNDGFGISLMGTPTGIPNIKNLVSGSINEMSIMPVMGDGSEYRFVEDDVLTLFTSSYNPVKREALVPTVLPIGSTLHSYYPTTWCSYWLTDGNVAAPVIFDYQAVSIIYPPPFKYIAKFDGSILLGGGESAVDPYSKLVNTAARAIFISRANNPFDITIPGAATPVFNYILVDEGEDINGLGLYTITTSDTGPQSKLAISTKNTLSLLDKVPTYSATGVLTASTLRVLSRKVGSIGQDTFVHTPMGTIFCGVDDVYILRDDGEPMPIGQNLYGLLKGADLARAQAVYHDQHYKLSFYHSDYAGTAGYNNVEVWLNTKKMMAKKSEDWVGPMVGRSVNFSFVEDRAGDGLTYNTARDRLCVDRQNKRVFKADVEPLETESAVLDFAAAVTSIIETKDMPISQQDNNWNKLLLRTYWKIRTNKLSTAPLSITELTYLDGVLTETKTLTASKTSSLNFHSEPLQLVRAFPLGRQRGRTVRKKISTTGRIAVAGFQINYAVEKRRI